MDCPLKQSGSMRAGQEQIHPLRLARVYQLTRPTMAALVGISQTVKVSTALTGKGPSRWGALPPIPGGSLICMGMPLSGARTGMAPTLKEMSLIPKDHPRVPSELCVAAIALPMPMVAAQPSAGNSRRRWHLPLWASASC